MIVSDGLGVIGYITDGLGSPIIVPPDPNRPSNFDSESINSTDNLSLEVVYTLSPILKTTFRLRMP